MSGVSIETVPAELAGQRIDNFLLRHLKGVPRTRIYRLLRRGEVRVNGGRVKPTRRLEAGDQVRIPPVRRSDAEAIAPSGRVLERLEAAICHEDARTLVLDKPSGLAVHGGSGIAYGVIEALRQLRPDCPFLDLAHRLDRDTSGCLVIAKRRSTLRELHAAFREGEVDKQYLALLHGDAGTAERRVDAPLRAEAGPGGDRIMRVHASGQSARTRFVPLRSYGKYTLVRAHLYTGRMHQIRAHAAHIGHPVAMDARYGDHEGDRRLRRLGLTRLFLHAERVAFDVPSTGPVTVTTALPTALSRLMETLDDAG